MMLGFSHLTEEYRLRVFMNRVLRRIFGPRRNKVTGAWTRSFRICTLTRYYSHDQIKKNNMGSVCDMYGR
jgi:hypothetical protein